MMSLFTYPHIKSINENDKSLSAEIYSKSKKCGSIYISNATLNYQVSCGFKISKGLMKIDDVQISYVNENLVLTSSSNSKKMLLNIGCSEEIYTCIKLYLEKMKKLPKDKPKKNKSFLFDK